MPAPSFSRYKWSCFHQVSVIINLETFTDLNKQGKMVQFVVTGAGRGIGLEFVNQLSQDSENVVFAVVRNKNKIEYLKPIADERPNVHVIEADVTSASALKQAAKEVAEITGGSLDVLISNAGGLLDPTITIADPNHTPEEIGNDFLENYKWNTVSHIYANNYFLPLLRKGEKKKIINISSGIADIQFTKTSKILLNAGYGSSKAALNYNVIKYALELEPEGFTVVALSPGFVDTSKTREGPIPEEFQKMFATLLEGFRRAQPDWDGKPISVEDSVAQQIQVINKLGPKDSGIFISQNGSTDKWL
jgi:NAD(P)-dependent dehydrogenase (short-subunit alcohol dehydrogenase family)